jgi:hypothetical protein
MVSVCTKELEFVEAEEELVLVEAKERVLELLELLEE